MRKKTLLTLIFILLSLTTMTSSVTNYSKRNFNSYEWKILIESIIEVESNGDSTKKSHEGTKEECVGLMQIKKQLVNDCNRILSLKDKGDNYRKILNIKVKKYFPNDRKNKEKSIEMFNIIQCHYNKKLNDKSFQIVIEEASKIWNGGPNCNRNSKVVKHYHEKVMKEFNKRYKKMGTRN